MPRYVSYLLLIIVGVSNGMIPLLIGSTLFIWLTEAGLNIQSIGLYGLANLPFAFSFAISVLLEYLSYTKIFSYKTIMIFCLIVCGIAIYLLPATISHHQQLFGLCLLLSLAASVVRIISTALQKTLFSDQQLVLVINLLTISYKFGMLIAGALALYYSQFKSWVLLYHSFAGLILIFAGLILIFPERLFNLGNARQNQFSLFQRLSKPFSQLWQLPQISLILLLMFCYRAPDNLIGHYFDLFYLHFGLTKTDVALGYKLYGMLIASCGGLLCIKVLQRHSYRFNLNLALALHLLSYLLVYYFSRVSAPHWVFYLCVSCEEFSRGMTMIIFWTFQTYICKHQHVIIQLAILTAIDSLSYSLLGALAGGLINHLGYANFILVIIASFIPAFVLLSQLKPAKIQANQAVN